MAPFSSRPVSSAMPKRPGPSASSTSSEVAPTSATSKSWMTPAPLVAIADTNPRSIRSISIGPEPGLDHVRAEAPDDAAVAAPARRRSRATTALKSAAARMSGSESTNAPTAGAGGHRPREVLHARLARARLQRIGRDAGEVEFVVGKRHGAPAITKSRSMARTGRTRASCIVLLMSATDRASRRRSCRTGTARDRLR